jgi:hypothetical protein
MVKRQYRLAIGVVASLVPPAVAEDLQFTRVNNSSHAIIEMYLSPTDKETWGKNILNVDSVETRTEGTIGITDGQTVCHSDMRFVTAKGATLEATHNMCELASFTLTD